MQRSGNSVVVAIARRIRYGNIEAELGRRLASTRDLGDAVEIRIRDTGTRIVPEIKDKQFPAILYDRRPGKAPASASRSATTS